MNHKNNMLKLLSDYRSCLMGIAIIWIVLFHSGIEAPENIILRALWYIFVSFGGGIGVDIFFILSGFGLFFSAEKAKLENVRNWSRWLYKRLERIIPSYLIVSILYYYINGNLSLYNICQLNFIIDGVRDFWFIPAIITCYIFFPIFYKISLKIGFKTLTLLSLLMIIIIIGLIYYTNPEYYGKIEIFLQRIPCFIIGSYWGYLYHKEDIKEYFIGIILSIILLPICIKIDFIGNSRWIFLFGTIIFIQILVIFLAFIGETFRKIFDYFGKRSLQIYLTHVSLGVIISNCVKNEFISLAVYFISAIIMGEILYRLINLIKKL